MDEEEYRRREPRSSLRTRFFWVFCFTFYIYASYEFVLRPLITFLENEIDSITVFILTSLAAVLIIYSIIGVAILAVERKFGKVVYSHTLGMAQRPYSEEKRKKISGGIHSALVYCLGNLLPFKAYHYNIVKGLPVWPAVL